ncbi:MAG TPA: G1 family glutamic endopeptidase [Acetobacteraceae bacterium]|jgi:hypothetical protein
MSATITEQRLHSFDEAEFLRRIPYRLERTNLPGAYSTLAPESDDYDPHTVPPSELVRHGLIMPRPDAATQPRLRAAWDKVFGRKWLARDRVTGPIVPQPGITHHLWRLPVRQEDGTFLGGAWSGAGTRSPSGTWTGIVGFWDVPTVSEPSEPQGTEGGWNSSSWIGIDGFFNSNDVLQAGVQQKVDAHGNATYVAWYEWVVPPPASVPPGTPVDANGYPLAWVGSPNGQYQYIYQANIPGFTVKPGQQVYCSAQYNAGKTAGLIYFANETTGQTFQQTLAPPPGASFSGQSVEWIMEAPDGGEPRSALPKFTPVTFTSALACGANNALADPSTGDTMNIETSGGKVLTSVTTGKDTTTISFIG